MASESQTKNKSDKSNPDKWKPLCWDWDRGPNKYLYPDNSKRQISMMRWVCGPLDWPETTEDPGKQDFLEARPLKEANTGGYHATDPLQNTCQMRMGAESFILRVALSPPLWRCQKVLQWNHWLWLLMLKKKQKLGLGKPFYGVEIGEFGM